MADFNVPLVDSNLRFVQKLYDFAGGSAVVYEGWAPSGAATSAAQWTIKKYLYTTGNKTAEVWASGQSNIWDNRASLTYS